jgi:hypothetical protein
MNEEEQVADEKSVEEHERFVNVIRNRTLDEVALEFDKLKNFGDTSQSFAAFVRNMKR